MNKIKVFGGLLLLILINIYIIKTHNLLFLAVITLLTYSIGVFINSARATFKRIRLFCLIGLSILLFQLLFNQLVPLEERVLIALRTILQISSISEIVFLGMQSVSPSKIVSAFNFLSPSWQMFLSMTFYFIPLLMTEQKIVQLVQKSRGLGNSPIGFFVPLLHRIFQRAETVSLTILSRGFKE